MSEKMTCPGCNAHSSSILTAVYGGDPCPHCGLSADAINEVDSIKRSKANEDIKDRAIAAELRADRAEAKIAALNAAIGRVKDAVAFEPDDL